MTETDNQFLVRMLSDVLNSDVLDEPDASRARDTIDLLSDPRCMISVVEEDTESSRKNSVEKAIEKSERLGLNWYIWQGTLVAYRGPQAGLQRSPSIFEKDAWERLA